MKNPMKDLKPNRANTLDMPGRKETPIDILVKNDEALNEMVEKVNKDVPVVNLPHVTPNYEPQNIELNTILFLRNQLDMVYINAFNAALQGLILDRLSSIAQLARLKPVEFKIEMDKCTTVAMKATEAFMHDYEKKEDFIDELITQKSKDVS